jgi:hypothetical protein
MIHYKRSKYNTMPILMHQMRISTNSDAQAKKKKKKKKMKIRKNV